jgi:hypothetical protein
MYFVFGNIGKETLMLNDSARPPIQRGQMAAEHQQCGYKADEASLVW